MPPDPLQRLAAQWQREVNRATRRWQAEVRPLQIATLLAQAEAAVHGENVDALANLQVPVLGVDLLTESARIMAANGVTAVLVEAQQQGVELPAPAPVAAIGLSQWAQAAAGVLAQGLGLSGGREALRLLRPGSTAAGVVDGLSAFLQGLTDRGVRDVVGGLLTRAQNSGRLAAYAMRPHDVELQLIADETLDANTCKPCRKIDGTVLPSPEAAALAYGGAGYLFCQGGERCRGTMRGTWTPGSERAAWSRSLRVLANLGDDSDTVDQSLQLAAGRMAR